MSANVTHEAANQRFTINTDGEQCVLDYRLADKVMTITHTGVPSALAGRGLAGDMTHAAFTTARENGWKVVPACSYAAGWVDKHPDFKNLLA